ncbi:hypothetical protein LX15_004609 [Streptoalloteichus tenebrarius]|uniref:Uncharacterized protein n=1 Tax=Streptoalloteichus tenebrarius (strain ATCC 17920 / DSM 40477 / JCM 4838 / CBS 697.72 / NBRC 16177 / NCIMB 11028 / NRRL B-12390 / A12253. 1 / ISP 5477) TaxID=1933 RepID=A0ABT1HZG6_STRSD|nr:hypothetical protein [Streptoalloteichus tenebrarius]MCP2260889.1 hypothetical protein [Streptoalloteichus tenebrarius]BFF03351.1 hypothetical protein GCM10020241_50260 [Streptoalloteichus tenebrarius]
MTNPLDDPRFQELQAELDRRMADLDQMAKEMMERPRPSAEVTAEDIAEMERFARGDKAPKELRELQRLVDEGELSWQDIAEGRGWDDERVRNALSAGLPDLQRAYAQLQEGADLDEVIASGQPRPATGGGGDDDDDGDSFMISSRW